MLVGYMRVSSDAKDDRPGLTQALSFVRAGDVLVVWKLDRLGRSLPHLLCIVNTLKEKQVAFRSLTEGMDTTTASGELLFHDSARLPSTNEP
jgi:DNA invertase Pin-like site-specific DNA recombinase